MIPVVCQDAVFSHRVVGFLKKTYSLDVFFINKGVSDKRSNVLCFFFQPECFSERRPCDSRWRGKNWIPKRCYTPSAEQIMPRFTIYFFLIAFQTVFEFLNLFWIHEKRTGPQNLLHDTVSHDTPAQRTIIPSLVTKGSAIHKTSAELRTVWKRRGTWSLQT